MSTVAALSFAGGFLFPAHNSSALGTGPRLSSVEQSGAQPLVRWQDGGAEPLADQGIADTLDADTRLPAVVKSKAVAAVIISALMHQPPDGPVLLVG